MDGKHFEPVVAADQIRSGARLHGSDCTHVNRQHAVQAALQPDGPARFYACRCAVLHLTSASVPC